jgi:serine protease inhibitor
MTALLLCFASISSAQQTEGTAVPPQTTDRPTVKSLSPLLRPSQRSAATSNRERVLDAQRAVASGLLLHLASQPSARLNIVVSPASLGMALAMLDLGADDDLKGAIRETLGFKSKNGKQAGDDLVGLRDGAKTLQADKEMSELFAAANAIVIDPASQPVAAGLRKAARSGATIFNEPPSTALVTHINEWVSSKTKGLIPSILERMPADFGLYVLSALYFKDKWAVQFDPGKTRQMPFQHADGSSSEVAMMSGRFERVPTRGDDRFVAAELRYAHDRFSLVLITTRDEPLPASGLAPVASWLDGKDFVEKSIELSLPRFESRESVELLEALEALGLKQSLASPTALKNFAAKPLGVSQVLQKTFLQVDEIGTKAAAATAAVATRSAYDAKIDSIVFDKPFLFALRDQTTGLVLICGYVGQPNQSMSAAKTGGP